MNRARCVKLRCAHKEIAQPRDKVKGIVEVDYILDIHSQGARCHVMPQPPETQQRCGGGIERGRDAGPYSYTIHRRGTTKTRSTKDHLSAWWFPGIRDATWQRYGLAGTEVSQRVTGLLTI